MTANEICAIMVTATVCLIIIMMIYGAIKS
jgi:hypothetical protein